VRKEINTGTKKTIIQIAKMFMVGGLGSSKVLSMGGERGIWWGLPRGGGWVGEMVSWWAAVRDELRDVRWVSERVVS